MIHKRLYIYCALFRNSKAICLVDNKLYAICEYLDVYTRSIYSLLPINILAGDIIKSYFLKPFINYYTNHENFFY